MASVNPYYQDAQVTLYEGDTVHVLKTLPAESIHTVVTSPPYWGLRDYGNGPLIWGGAVNHAHVWGDPIEKNATNHTDKRRWQHTRNGRDEEQPTEKRVAWLRTAIDQGTFCACGAWSGALGLEPTFKLYVEHMVAVFREVRRVLREDGTLWLNLGDCYHSGDRGGYQPSRVKAEDSLQKGNLASDFAGAPNRMPQEGLKDKDLVGIPWRVAFALQADGWYLRSDIIWSKPNPMPESVTDRPTKAHEYLFLLTKAPKYHYDAMAIREPNSSPEQLAHNLKYAKSYEAYDSRAAATGQPGNVNNVGIHSRPGKAATSPRNDGNAWNENNGRGFIPTIDGRNKRSVWEIPTAPYPEAHFATFPPDLIKPCILAGCPEGGVALDPFVGSGTTALVAKELGLKAIGIDQNPAYLEMARKRLGQETIWGVSA